jgi:hypothetical protein
MPAAMILLTQLFALPPSAQQANGRNRTSERDGHEGAKRKADAIGNGVLIAETATVLGYLTQQNGASFVDIFWP